MESHTDKGSELLLDDALRPILISTWIGPATLDLVDEFYRWCDGQVAKAKRRGYPVILISDATLAGRPNADVRKAFAAAKFDVDVPFKSIVIINNKIIRGAMTAIGWLLGDMSGTINCRSLAEALPIAVAAAEAHDRVVPVPSSEVLADYVARSEARVASQAISHQTGSAG